MTYTPCDRGGAAVLFCCRVFTGEARFEAACGKAAGPDGGTYGPPQECDLTIGKNGFEGQQNRETTVIRLTSRLLA